MEEVEEEAVATTNIGVTLVKTGPLEQTGVHLYGGDTKMKIERFEDGWHITFINLKNKEETYIHPFTIKSLIGEGHHVITEELIRDIFKDDATAASIVFNINQQGESITPPSPVGTIPVEVISNE
jgi:hypothetical protein